jgi:hypothetical protein
MMSKWSDELRTPPWLFKESNDVTPFFWDGCCNKENCLIERQKLYELPDNYDYLTFDFKLASNEPLFKGQSIFINPPYSRGSVGPIIQKAWGDAKHFRVVLLLKADMSTDWFNDILEADNYNFQPVHQHELNGTLFGTYSTLISRMNREKNNIGILHLRKRIKFYGTEEMMREEERLTKDGDYADRPNYRYSYDINGNKTLHFNEGAIETKNFKRVDDGIICKSGGTFPSMIMVLDRRVI